MDKYLITSFKSEIANAILNSQEKLNPDKNAFIDKNELPKVLDFFGVDDVSKLLKTSEKQSVFENTKSASQEETNEDTVEISSTQTTPEEQTNDDTVEISSSTQNDNDAIATYGSAANELDCRIRTDMTLNSTGTPFSQQLKALEREMNVRLSANTSTTDIFYKIDALNDLVLDYLREHPEENKEHLYLKEIKYGKNNSKKALLGQTFGLSGNNAFGDDGINTAAAANGTATEDTGDSSGNKTANADVYYNVDFRTLNPKEQGNWHIKGTINAGSNNSDIHGAFQYTKPYKNGGVLNFTGNLRETIKNKDNIGSFGASLDYRVKKFSTGAYGMYCNRNTNGGDSSSEKYAELYGQFSNAIYASGGIQDYEGAKYYYAKGLAQGKKEFSDINLTFDGGIGGEYGVYKYNIEDVNSKITALRVKGGVSFKSKDLSAKISGDVKVSNTKSTYVDITNKTKTTTGSFLVNVSTKNVDLSSAVSTINVKGDNQNNNLPDIDSSTSVTASISIGLKNIFGKNIMPVLKYNVGNYDGASQNVGAGVIVTP